MWLAIERSHKLDPTGNVSVTFHSSHGLPEAETKVFDKKLGEEISTEIVVINERDGQFNRITPKMNYMLGEKPDVKKELEAQNKKIWDTALAQVSFHTMQGKESVEAGLSVIDRISDKEKINPEIFGEKNSKEAMKKYWIKSKTEEGQKFLKENVYNDPLKKRIVESGINSMTHGQIYVNESYTNLQENFNRAWDSLQKTIKKSQGEEKKKAEEDFEKLKKYQQEMKNKKDELFRSDKIEELAEQVQKGVNMLNSLSKNPQLFKPLNEFAVEKASETFANLAWNAYKKFGNSAPVISIENPPVGAGTSRAEDLKELIKETRRRFVETAQKKEGMSKEEAERAAEKLVGATWDLGHINMLRKYGYEKNELVEQTKKIAPFINKVHLSDNFGMEHTELPMGMGNVPTKEHMNIINKYNEKVKKIIETTDWYQHFQTTPFAETLAAFGSPIYSMNLAPYWNKAGGAFGGYFSGFGYNPEIHHSMYGAGFANLPVELGGQMAGKSRLSGAPME
jgi:sugar phosphate isomerase/epimerase